MREALSKLVFYFLLGFIFGVAISPFFNFFLASIGLLIAVFLFSEKKEVLILIILSFSTGLVYYQLFSYPEFKLPLFADREVEVVGRVVDEDKNFLEIKDFRGSDLSEKAVVYMDGTLKHGQLLKIKGTPVPIEDDFQNYFHTHEVSVSFFDPDVSLIGKDYSFRSHIYSKRRTLSKKISGSISFPQSALLRALLLGDRVSIPDNLQDRFSKIGIAHLLAVSGTHIVIVSGLIASFLSLFAIKFKYLISTALLFGFVLLVGAPISAVRAGLIGLLFILAQKTGRKTNSLRGLIFIAFFMILSNPRIIFGSVSFQLSFSAALGISIFSGKIKKILTTKKTIFKKSKINEVRNELVNIFIASPDFFSDTLAVTFSAQIFTLPLVYYHFENLPLLAPLSNLIIGPLIPVLMIFGFLSLFLSFIIPGSVAFLPTYIIATIVLSLARILHLTISLW